MFSCDTGPAEAGRYLLVVSAFRRTTRELFYLRGDSMMAVDITTVTSFRAGMPRRLFEGRYMYGPGVTAYDLSPDGQRFLRVQPVHPDPPENQINVVLNWTEELASRLRRSICRTGRLGVDSRGAKGLVARRLIEPDAS